MQLGSEHPKLCTKLRCVRVNISNAIPTRLIQNRCVFFDLVSPCMPMSFACVSEQCGGSKIGSRLGSLDTLWWSLRWDFVPTVNAFVGFEVGSVDYQRKVSWPPLGLFDKASLERRCSASKSEPTHDWRWRHSQIRETLSWSLWLIKGEVKGQSCLILWEECQCGTRIDLLSSRQCHKRMNIWLFQISFHKLEPSVLFSQEQRAHLGLRIPIPFPSQPPNSKQFPNHQNFWNQTQNKIQHANMAHNHWPDAASGIRREYPAVEWSDYPLTVEEKSQSGRPLGTRPNPRARIRRDVLLRRENANYAWDRPEPERRLWALEPSTKTSPSS